MYVYTYIHNYVHHRLIQTPASQARAEGGGEQGVPLVVPGRAPEEAAQEDLCKDEAEKASRSIGDVAPFSPADCSPPLTPVPVLPFPSAFRGLQLKDPEKALGSAEKHHRQNMANVSAENDWNSKQPTC